MISSAREVINVIMDWGNSLYSFCFLECPGIEGTTLQFRKHCAVFIIIDQGGFPCEGLCK